MLYALLIYGAEQAEQSLPPALLQQVMDRFLQYNRELMTAGVLRSGAQLVPTSAASTVRLVDGQLTTEQGPFAAAPLQLGGFYIIEVADHDAALDWARRCPGASLGSVEVRPVVFAPR